MDNDIAGVLAIICIFGLPIIGWITVRAFHFIERMEMIKRGIIPPPNSSFGFGRGRAYRAWAEQQQQQARAGAPPPWQQQGSPQWQQQGVPPPGFQARNRAWGSCDDDAQRALHKGIRLALIGLAITIGLAAVFGGSRGNPAILGGLIPMFVGIAQIIIAVLSGAQLPGVTGRMYGAPPPPSSGPAPTGPIYNGPPSWEQPGRPHLEEIAKPVQPPDIR